MHIDIVPNRNSKPAVLLRESYRDAKSKKPRKRTLANLSKLPSEQVDAIRRILKGQKLVSLEDAFEIVENGSRHHGHVDAVLSAMRQLGFEKLVGSRHSPERDLVVAMVVARILEPQSKLATSLWWHTTTPPEILGVSDADEDDLYAAMDWVLKRQEVIEKKLAARHLQNDGLALYDLTSSYFEGVSCPLARHPDFPNERLVACRNPELAERRRHKSRALLEATCKELEKVCRMVERRRLHGKEDIRATVKKLLNKYKVGKYYRLDIRDDGFDFELDETTMDADASRLANGNSELANKRLQRWKRHMGTIVKQLERIRQRIGRGQLHGKDKIGVRVGKVLGSPVVSGDLICVGGHGLWTLPRLWKTPETPGKLLYLG